MKKVIAFIISILTMFTALTVTAAEIPRETAPLVATEEQIKIVEDLISDILYEVATGNLGYTLAAGYANTRIRKSVMAGQTNGHGYGILSPIAQNAIRGIHDELLRPEVYAQYEEELMAFLADITEDVANGRDYENARKAAYLRLYQTIDPAFTNPEAHTDLCYVDFAAIDMARFSITRKLLCPPLL